MFKKILKVIGILVVVLVLGCVALVACSGDVTHSEEDIQTVVDSAKTYNYDELVRSEDLKGCSIKVGGEVLQAGDGWYRVAVGGNYDHVVLVDYTLGEDEERILEEDNIEVYGICQGLSTYETILGEEVTIPEIEGYKVKRY